MHAGHQCCQSARGAKKVHHHWSRSSQSGSVDLADPCCSAWERRVPVRCRNLDCGLIRRCYDCQAPSCIDNTALHITYPVAGRSGNAETNCRPFLTCLAL